MEFKLQTNNKGAWRDVVRFEAARVDEVKAAAIPLAEALGADTKWRLERSDGESFYLRGRRWLTLRQWRARGYA